MTAASAKDLLMRYTPAALALSLLVAVTASVSFSAPPQPLDPRASALLTQGRAQLAAGHVEEAVDAYEAALTVQPGNVAILLDLAEATRRQGMQGKALRYYREALTAEPSNVMAISGEGAAFVEKGAVEKAKENLAKIQKLCPKTCAEGTTLAAVIAKGPPVMSATAQVAKQDAAEGAKN